MMPSLPSLNVALTLAATSTHANSHHGHDDFHLVPNRAAKAGVVTTSALAPYTVNTNIVSTGVYIFIPSCRFSIIP